MKEEKEGGEEEDGVGHLFVSARRGGEKGERRQASD